MTQTQALSTFVYRRGLFSWGLGILKIAPYAFGGAGAGILGGIEGIVSCTLTTPSHSYADLATCITASAFSLHEGALTAVDQAVKANRALSAANEVFQLSAADWLDIIHYIVEPFVPPAIEGLESEKPAITEHKHSGLYNAHDHSEVTWLHMVRANETHPIHIYYNGKYPTGNATLKMWSSLHNKTNCNHTSSSLLFNFPLPLYSNPTFDAFPKSAEEKIRKLIANENALGSMGYPGAAHVNTRRSFT